MMRVRTLTSWFGLVSLLLVAIWVLLAEDVDQISGLRDNIQRKEQLLHRLKSLPAKESAIREKLQDLSDSASEKYLYQGDRRNTQTLMQHDLRQIAAGLNIRIGSMRTLGNSIDLNRMSMASVQLNLVMTNDQLLELLSAIEVKEPLLRVQRMSVRIQRPSTIDQPAQLAVVLEVAGYHQRNEVSS